MCQLVEVFLPCDGNVESKDAEKLKYKSLTIEVCRIRVVQTEVVPIMFRALGVVSLSFAKLNQLPGLAKECDVQNIALLGSANILRKVL